MAEPVLVAGIDEAGRGCLAGPVVAAAVILGTGPRIDGLADSKALRATDRTALAREIRARSVSWALGFASAGEIDRMNVLQGTLLAMRRAVLALAVKPGGAVIDGPHGPALDMPCRTVIGADASIPEVSAASIVAKAARDALMVRLDEHYPGYGFARHKGYPTRAHRQALLRFGICRIHRLSFAPVRALLD